MKNKGKKIRVAIVFGGKSAEHEISLQSAKSVYEVIDKDKYEVVLAGIDRSGRWHLSAPEYLSQYAEDPRSAELSAAKGGAAAQAGLAFIPGEGGHNFMDMTGKKVLGNIDVAFPVLHGPFGEDGTVQGMLKLADVPFVGSGVLGSAVGMDKDVQKRLLRDAGIPHANFTVVSRGDIKELSYPDLIAKLGAPFFIKPANLGSSIGVHKVYNEEQFKAAIKDAFSYDSKILVEECIGGRELECAVLGNEEPLASIVGEIIPGGEFYSYEAKYRNENGATLAIPASLTSEVAERVKSLAIKTFKALSAEGMARVDFFLRENNASPDSRGDILVNEINTIPGFTKISMYPRLWEASGVPYRKLIDKLLTLAIQRADKEKKLKTIYES